MAYQTPFILNKKCLFKAFILTDKSTHLLPVLLHLRCPAIARPKVHNLRQGHRRIRSSRLARKASGKWYRKFILDMYLTNIPPSCSYKSEVGSFWRILIRSLKLLQYRHRTFRIYIKIRSVIILFATVKRVDDLWVFFFNITICTFKNIIWNSVATYSS